MKFINRLNSGCYVKMKISRINVKFYWINIVELLRGDKLKKYRNDFMFYLR